MNKTELVQAISENMCPECNEETNDCGEEVAKCGRVINSVQLLEDFISDKPIVNMCPLIGCECDRFNEQIGDLVCNECDNN